MDKKLFEKVLKMPPNERITFAELILASLDYEEDEIRYAWIKEINDRMKAVKEGKARLLDFEDMYNAG
ncbi:MAG: addiction module protein [Ignavibacteriales bacterium]|nr:addiction module protein [Ignavibacteriales bacterium]